MRIIQKHAHEINKIELVQDTAEQSLWDGHTNRGSYRKSTVVRYKNIPFLAHD